jgi:tape measure domain-containing protein
LEGGDLGVSSIEERVVGMRFDNAQFSNGVKSTISDLDALKKSLKLDGAAKGLNDVATAGKNVQLGHIASAVDSLGEKFKTLSIVGITALTNITNKAFNAGYALVRSLTVDPVKAGLQEYETNLNSIQTILSNTKWQNTNLDQVNKALQELNLYSDQTIYNFSEMARNIGTFTAAGVKLDVATGAIKGIANLAAVSGSNAEQASTAMYQLSQALAAGKVSLMDWNSVVNAGMGGKVFQDSLLETARVHGVAVDDIIKKQGSFRDSLQEGWLTSEILTETLSKFTGDLSAEQLKAMGYTEKQIAQIVEMGKTAQDAATKVKTFSQLISTLQEAVGSGWSQTWQLIFGDFEEAKAMWTNVNNVLGKFIASSSEARNKVLGDWKELGGRTVLIEAIGNAFNALLSVLRPIRDAFQNIFPAMTGKQLYELTVAVRDFTAGLKLSSTGAENLRRIFAGLFSVFGIGWDIIKQVAITLAHLFGVAAQGSGSFLSVAAKVGDFIVNLREAINKGHALELIFDAIEKVLKGPIQLVGLLGKALVKMFSGFDAIGASKSVTGFVAKLEPITKLGDLASAAWGGLFSILGGVWDVFYPLAEKMADFFGKLGGMITSALQGVDYSDILGSINTSLLGGLVMGLITMFHKFVKGDTIFGSIKDSIEQLTDTMQTMQNTLRAATLIQIALAIAILTVSVNALSKIDSAGLTRALTAMTVMFTQLFASMMVFEKALDLDKLAGMSKLAFGMILLGAAIDVLTIAVTRLAKLDWNALARGLTGVIVLLAGLTASMRFMPETTGMIATGTGLVILAAAINVLVRAVTDLSGLSWEEMAKGLVGVGTLLAALTLFTKFAEMDKGGILQGAGLVLLAASIKILASAVGDFIQYNWEQIARGLTAMAGGLTLMSAALYMIPPTAIFSGTGILITVTSLGLLADAMAKMATMSWGGIGKAMTELAGALTLMSLALIMIPPSSVASAVALVGTAAALLIVAQVLEQFGAMSWGEIGKAMTVLAGSLILITTAMIFATAAVPGAAAILIMAAALAILTPILLTLAQMSLGEIGTALLALAGVFAVLGVAGLLLGPVVPILFALGAAIILIGAGVALAGVGVLALSAGLTALSVAGAAGTAVLVGMVSALIGLIPMALTQIGLGLVAIAKVIITSAPVFAQAIITVISSLLDLINTLFPKFIIVATNIITLLLQTLVNLTPRIVQAGCNIVIAILTGIANNIGMMVQRGVDIVVNFINGVSAGIPKVIEAGVNLILNFINSLTNAINGHSSEMGAAGGRLAVAIVTGMVNGIRAGVGQIADAARGVAESALNAAKSFLGINSPSKEFELIGKYSTQGFANGLETYSKISTAAAESVGNDALNSLKMSLRGVNTLVDSGVDMTPTIRPVLDLTDVQKNAGILNKLLAASPLYVGTSYDKANYAATSYTDNQNAAADSSAVPQTTTTFIQNITSPKAVSSAEIYRQTNNQISIAKGAVTV